MGERAPAARGRRRRGRRSEPGVVYFETRGVERLYGGVEAALKKALSAVGSAWDARAGAAERRFAALAAANVARPGQILVVSDEQARDFLAPLPLDLLPLAESRQQELRELGVRRLGELAGLPGAAVAERLGAGRPARVEPGERRRRRRIRGRRPPAELVESLEFPEAVANELTLRRAFAVLLERVLDRPERDDRFVRKAAVAARLVGGGSWRRTVTLRDPTAEHDRLRAALGPKLAELPAPVVELRLELVELSASRGQQLELVRGGGRDRGAPAGGPAPGACEHRRRLRVHRRRGGAVVADSGSARALRASGRLNEPRPALVVATGRRAAVRQPSVGRARARGVARRRPLVDGGADRRPLLRRRARLGPERRRLPRRGAVVLVHPARCLRRSG